MQITQNITRPQDYLILVGGVPLVNAVWADDEAGLAAALEGHPEHEIDPEFGRLAQVTHSGAVEIRWMGAGPDPQRPDVVNETRRYAEEFFPDMYAVLPG
jgi:hypothetical protein